MPKPEPNQPPRPRGRPPKRPWLEPALRRLLRERRPEDPADPHGGLTNREALVRTTLELALKGDPQALKLVWERIDGKVADPVHMQVGGQEGAPLQVVVEYVTVPAPSSAPELGPEPEPEPEPEPGGGAPP
jgi:hypothetical protein